jgi:hypothetical protein
MTPTPMSPEAMRVAIATLEGFNDVRTERQYEETGGMDGYDGWFDVLVGDIDGETRKVPDWPNDLNACYVLEEPLTEKEGWDYAAWLLEVVCLTSSEKQKLFNKTHPDAWAIHTTATQKCEAFLRAKELYVEGGK